MKRIRVFRTAEEFVQWINETFPKSKGDDRTDVEYALWAICLQEAHAVFNGYTTKDMAGLLFDGVEAYKSNPMESIQAWLTTIIEELETALVDGDEHLDADSTIDAETADEYGVVDVVELIRRDYAPNSAQDNDEDED